MQIICRIAGHHRSSRRARIDYEAQRWISVCKHCDRPMIRIASGNWRMEQDEAG